MTVPLTIEAVVTDATGNVGLASVTVEVVRPAAFAAEREEMILPDHGPRQTYLHVQERARQGWNQVR